MQFRVRRRGFSRFFGALTIPEQEDRTKRHIILGSDHISCPKEAFDSDELQQTAVSAAEGTSGRLFYCVAIDK